MSPDGRIALSGSDETYITALGDGTAKPGDAVGKVGATGKVVQCDVGVSELFIGFLMPNSSDSTSVNTAIGDGVPCKIVLPKSTHIYACHIENPAGTKYAGQPMGMSDTAGAMEFFAAMSTAGVKGHFAADVATGDTYGKVRWQ